VKKIKSALWTKAIFKDVDVRLEKTLNQIITSFSCNWNKNSTKNVLAQIINSILFESEWQNIKKSVMDHFVECKQTSKRLVAGF